MGSQLIIPNPAAIECQYLTNRIAIPGDKRDISMPLRLKFQLNVRTVHPDFVGAHPLRRRRAEHLAGADLELGAMPGASDLVALEFPLREGSAAMRTSVVDGVELTVHVKQGDLLSLHLNQFPVVRFKLARLRYFDIFGHANLLDRSTFLRGAVVVRQSAAKQDVPSVSCRLASRSAPRKHSFVIRYSSAPRPPPT